MVKRIILGASLAVALPVIAAAQAPGSPNQNASDTAKAKVALHRATQVRGSVIRAQGIENRPVTPAMPSEGAEQRGTGAVAGPGGVSSPAVPATPAKPATPASPSQKPESPGQSGSHRP